MKDWPGDLMAGLREVINKADPTLEEDWKWETPPSTYDGNVCAVGAFKDSVKLNFFKGASLPDPHHLFNGGLEAKASRSIDIREGDQLNEPALQELIRSAIAHNSKR